MMYLVCSNAIRFCSSPRYRPRMQDLGFEHVVLVADSACLRAPSTHMLTRNWLGRGLSPSSSSKIKHRQYILVVQYPVLLLAACHLDVLLTQSPMRLTSVRLPVVMRWSLLALKVR